MRMHNPPHPGETLRTDVIAYYGMSVTEAANALGVSRGALSRVLQCRASISPMLALRIEAWLGESRGGRAETWLAMQGTHDLWHLRNAKRSELKRVKPAPEVAVKSA